MTDDLVERVARAVYQAEGGYDANDPRTFWKAVDSYWHDGVWSAWESQARLAIATIKAAGYVVVPREPTEKMLAAVENDHYIQGGLDDCNKHNIPLVAWRIMIDAALEKDKADVG